MHVHVTSVRDALFSRSGNATDSEDSFYVLRAHGHPRHIVTADSHVPARRGVPAAHGEREAKESMWAVQSWSGGVGRAFHLAQGEGGGRGETVDRWMEQNGRVGEGRIVFGGKHGLAELEERVNSLQIDNDRCVHL